jgi:hypothetical protein
MNRVGTIQQSGSKPWSDTKTQALQGILCLSPLPDSLLTVIEKRWLNQTNNSMWTTFGGGCSIRKLNRKFEQENYLEFSI